MTGQADFGLELGAIGDRNIVKLVIAEIALNVKETEELLLHHWQKSRSEDGVELTIMIFLWSMVSTLVSV